MRTEFQDIVDDVSRLLGGPVTLEDREFNLIAFCSQHAAQIDEIREHSILERHSTREVRDLFERFGIATADHPIHIPASREMLARLCLPVRWNGVTYGYVWLLGDRSSDHGRHGEASNLPAAMALADRAGSMLAQRARVRGELSYKVEDLLSTDRQTVELAAAELDEMGALDRHVPLAVVDLGSALPSRGQPLPLNLWALPRSVLSAPMDEHVMLLVPVPGGDPKQAVEVARRVIDEHIPAPGEAEVVAGIGDIREEVTLVRESWHEARLASRVARAVPDLRPVATWAELGVYRLVSCGPERALSDAVLDPAVMRLIEYPDRELIETATVYLDAGGSVHRTAETLSVHRQTVYYRVQRIEEITGMSLASGKNRLRLNLALTLAPLLAHDRRR